MNDERARAGVIHAAALVVGLIGTFLWVSMLTDPWRLASGLLNATKHLQRAERALSRTQMKEARYETLAAVAAAERAREGFTTDDPVIHLARSFDTIDRAYGELDHLLRAVELSSRAAKGTLDVAQNALRGPDKIVARDPEDEKGGALIRLDRVEDLGRTISEVRAAIQGVERELRDVRLGRLPRAGRDNVTEGIEKAAETNGLLADAEAGFELLPRLLGGDGARTYLFGMQNSAEQRGPGGALLQFKLMSIANGKPELLDTGGTIYEIDRDRKQIDIPLPEDAWYVREIPDAQRFGNANWSPDWPLSAQLTRDYAEASQPDFPEVDGVFALDPLVMQELMPGVGQFRTNQHNLYITQNRVLFLLLYKAYASYPIPKVRRNRLSDIVDTFYERMLRPKHPTELLEGFGSSLAGKHMQIWMADPAEQRFIERMNWDGSIDEAKRSDYLYVVEQNVGGNKLDLFTHNTTSVDVRLSDTDAEVSVDARVANDVFLPQPLYPMGDSGKNLDTNGYHRPMMNVYVPSEAQLGSASVDGQRIDTPAPAVWPGEGTPAQHEERGKRVWSATLEIPPRQEGALRLDYRVPDAVREERGRKVYRLTIQRQPRVRPDQLSLRIRLPEGARDVKAKGFERDGDTLVWDRPLREDIVLEVSWQS